MLINWGYGRGTGTRPSDTDNYLDSTTLFFGETSFLQVDLCFLSIIIRLLLLDKPVETFKLRKPVPRVLRFYIGCYFTIH